MSNYKYGYSVNLKSYNSSSSVYTAPTDGIALCNFNLHKTSETLSLYVDGNRMAMSICYSSAMDSTISNVFVKKGQKIYYMKTSSLVMGTNAWVIFMPYTSY